MKSEQLRIGAKPCQRDGPSIKMGWNRAQREVSTLGTFSWPLRISSMDGQQSRDIEATVDTAAAYTTLPTRLLRELGVAQQTGCQGPRGVQQSRIQSSGQLSKSRRHHWPARHLPVYHHGVFQSRARDQGCQEADSRFGTREVLSAELLNRDALGEASTERAFQTETLSPNQEHES